MRSELLALAERFERRDISHEDWTHEAHLRVGLFYVLDDPARARDRMRQGILALNAVHGIEQTPERGYHETLTLLWMRLLELAWARYQDWDDVWQLLQDRKIALRFYTRERIMSWEARTSWLEPDLLPIALFPRT